jgi:predicted Zn-dependent protease
MGSLAKATEASGDANAAALAFGEIVLRSPANHTARSHLAAMLVKQGRIDQALRTLQEGIARAPSAPELRRALGSTLEDAQRPTEAAAAYRAYARLAPGAADAKDLLDRAERLAPGSTSGT